MKLKISLVGSKYLKGGQEYIKVDKSTVIVKIVQMKLHFDNLFRGDKVLSDLGNQLINQNIQMFIKDVEPAQQRSLCKLFRLTSQQNN